MSILFSIALIFTVHTEPGSDLSVQIRGDTVHIGKVERAIPKLAAQQFVPLSSTEEKEMPTCGPSQEGMVLYRTKYHADSQTGALLVCTYEGGLGKYMWHALD